MKHFLAVPAFIAIFLTGCATFDKDVTPKAAAAVMTYCATPQAERMLIRESVNSRVAPNSIKITCAGDVP